MQDAISRKLEETRKCTIRKIEIRKKMVDAELTFDQIREALNLTFGEEIRFRQGRLIEKEKEFEELVSSTDPRILKRDKEMKKFRKLMIEKGISMGELERRVGKERYAIYKAVRGVYAERPLELERKIEDVLGEKIF